MKENMSKLIKRIEKINLKLYHAYLEGSGCRLTITDIEDMHNIHGEEWAENFDRVENEKMKELM